MHKQPSTPSKMAESERYQVCRYCTTYYTVYYAMQAVECSSRSTGGLDRCVACVGLFVGVQRVLTHFDLQSPIRTNDAEPGAEGAGSLPGSHFHERR